MDGSIPRGPTFDQSTARERFTSDEAVERYSDHARTPELFEQERAVVERYFDEPGARVLDVGCGVGRVSGVLDEMGFEVTGIDISEPMVVEARSLFPDIDFHVADITDCDLPSASFEYVIFSYFGLDYVLPEQRRFDALREIFRLLTAGGIFTFSSHNSWYTVPGLLAGDLSPLERLYETVKRTGRLPRRYRVTEAPLGRLDVYVTNPLRQRRQLRKSGFTLLDVVGKRDGPARFVENHPYYVAKK